MSPSSAVVSRFSTDDVAPRDRIALWRELVFQSSFDVDIAQIGRASCRERV